jgi:hypothetical protein
MMLAGLSSGGTAGNPGNVIFQDNFSKPMGGWATGSNSHQTVGYSHRSLFVKMKKAGEGYAALATTAPQARNIAFRWRRKTYPDTRGRVMGLTAARSTRRSLPTEISDTPSRSTTMDRFALSEAKHNQ